MNNRICRILFTGGGSGGPTTPLLALAQTLREMDKINCEFRFLGTRNGPEQSMVEESGIPFHVIPAGKLRRYWNWRNLSDPLKIFSALFIGAYHLFEFRPNVVVSAGSFVSVPVALVCGLFHVPHLILQMDVRPGLANRLMSPFCRAVACYFETSLSDFERVPLRKVIGPVVRKDILESDPMGADKRFGLDPILPLLTITGGSQGALHLNKTVGVMLEIWLKRWQVVHLTGKGNSGAKLQHPHYHPIEFVGSGMGDLLARSELVITRAGMGLLGELAVLAKDALVIPLHGTHQEENAKTLEQKQAVRSMDQNTFSKTKSEVWEAFISNYNPGQLGRQLYETWSGPGNNELADLTLKCIKHMETREK